ncbi:hypothetical protein HaLaN_31240, partial [Haematococcus lacustris]
MQEPRISPVLRDTVYCGQYTGLTLLRSTSSSPSLVSSAPSPSPLLLPPLKQAASHHSDPVHPSPK